MQCCSLLFLMALSSLNLVQHARDSRKISGLFCTFTLNFVAFHLSLFFASFRELLLQLFRATNPRNAKGHESNICSMDHNSSPSHLPDNFSLLTSSCKSCRLLYNAWGLRRAWWVKSVAIGCFPCGVCTPTRPIRLVCVAAWLESLWKQVEVQLFIETICIWICALLDS